MSSHENFTFEDLNLDPQLMKAIESQGYKTPTEIQQKVIPVILKAEQDVMASAETGAGKTVAYLLPTLNRLLTTQSPVVQDRHTGQGRGPRVLILTPTRELADQVTETIRKLAKFTQLKMGVITGGVPYYAQEQLLRKPVDIVVATPGRLMDHMDKGRVDLARIEVLVLDEADRMLDMGFINDIEYILENMPAKRQILLFSATLEGQVQRIARRYLSNPVLVQLNENSKPSALITQKMHQADDFSHKRALLLHILKEPTTWQTIVFTATKRGADELVEDLLQADIVCAALHGDMKQRKRTQTLDRMRSGKLPVLIATDVASRGIDVKNLSHVVNFDLPRSVEDYVHRIGRTGRCGEKGTAISLVGPKDWSLVSTIERATGQRLERAVIAGLEPKKVANKPSFNSGSGRGREGYRSGNGGNSGRSNGGRSGGYGRSGSGGNDRRSGSYASSGSSPLYRGDANRSTGSDARSPRRFGENASRSEGSSRPHNAYRSSEGAPRRSFEGDRARSAFSGENRSSGAQRKPFRGNSASSNPESGSKKKIWKPAKNEGQSSKRAGATQGRYQSKGAQNETFKRFAKTAVENV